MDGPMLSGVSLTLIVSGMGQELAQSVQLAQLAARGSLRFAWDPHDLEQGTHHSWQRGLLWVLQLEPAVHSSAPLSALAQGFDTTTDDWLHLDPVHLAAGLNHLSLVELRGELALTQLQRTVLEPVLREHLAEAEMQLRVLPDGGWLVQLRSTLQLRTVCPSAAAANELATAMPQGASGAQLKRLMTELQMLAHQHSAALARQGLPEANAFWLWGNGRIAPAMRRALPLAFGEHDYLRGIYRHYGSEVQATPASGHELLERLSDGPRVLVMLDASSPAKFEQQWLAPLVAALRARRLRSLDLILDGWHLSIDRRGLRRFWRRPLPPGSWVA